MLEFVTKHEYWKCLDAGLDMRLVAAQPSWRRLLRRGDAPWHLKSVQDVMALHYLDDPRDQDIAEIGGGHSRVLPLLVGANRCVNIEKFEGQDGGPVREVRLRGVRNVRAFIGEHSPDLEAGAYDVLFSVSVVEHVTNDAMGDFIDDCHRILRPGGRMVHLVDMYLSPDRAAYNRGRIACYRSAFAPGLFEPAAQLRIDAESNLPFDEAYCTNPDNIMYGWSQVAPALRALRERSQSVTIAWAGRKMPAPQSNTPQSNG